VIKQTVEYSKLEDAPAMFLNDLHEFVKSLGNNVDPMEFYRKLVCSLDDANAPKEKLFFKKKYFNSFVIGARNEM